MARKKMHPEELERRKLERRAKKKADRLAKKTQEATDFTVVKTKKGQSALIEVEDTDKQAILKMAELVAEGKAIRRGYATGFFIFQVEPGTPTPGNAHGDASAKGFDSGPKTVQTKDGTVADLVAIINDNVSAGGKLNKRFVKLLVRGSSLKRNLRKEAVSTLLKQYKLK